MVPKAFKLAAKGITKLVEVTSGVAGYLFSAGHRGKVDDDVWMLRILYL